MNVAVIFRYQSGMQHSLNTYVTFFCLSVAGKREEDARFALSGVAGSSGGFGR